MPLLTNAQMTVASAPGTGTVTLGSATSGAQTWAAGGAADGAVLSYRIEEAAAWEIGSGTYTASGTKLARTTVLASSNGNAAVNFGAGAIVSQVALPGDIMAPLGFVPVQQGGGANQGTNKVYLGYDGSNAYPRLQVDGTDMGQILCAAQALLTLGPTGKIKLFGLLIQWDTITSSASGFAVSFPVAFASACIGVLPVSTYPAGSNTAYVVNYDTPTKSGCNIQTRCITGSSVANQPSLPIVYFALGY